MVSSVNCFSVYLVGFNEILRFHTEVKGSVIVPSVQLRKRLLQRNDIQGQDCCSARCIGKYYGRTVLVTLKLCVRYCFGVLNPLKKR